MLRIFNKNKNFKSGQSKSGKFSHYCDVFILAANYIKRISLDFNLFSYMCCSWHCFILAITCYTLFLHPVPQVENDFILPLEKEAFIEQLKDIVDKAEDMLSEDTEAERNSDRGSSPKQTEGACILGTEVRKKLLTVNDCSEATFLRVPLP